MSNEINHILVIKPSSMGDILHLFPALEFLRREYPSADIDFMIQPSFSSVLDFAPCRIRRRIYFERQKLGRFPASIIEFFKLRRELRKEYYDLVIDFQGLIRSAVFAAMTRRRRLAGFARPRESSAAFFYSEKLSLTPGLHAADRNWQLACSCAAAPAGGTYQEYNVPYTEEKKTLQREKYLVISSAARWQSKSFPAKFFAAVIKAVGLKHPEYKFLLTGTAEEKPKAAEIIKLLPADFPVVDLTGRTSIRELFELIRRAAAILSNDTGPLHAAAVFDTPSFALYGPTDPELTGPIGSRAKIYRRQELPCLGCLKRKCSRRETLCHMLDPEQTAADISAELAKQDRLTDPSIEHK